MKLDALAIGPHPDDLELGCGGTLALLARRGLRVGIVHLTRGERGTRGTPEERRTEAENAARVLGAVELDFLDCNDGSFRHGEAEEDALIERLRAWRPEFLLGPSPSDRHPDHARAFQLVQAASFYAGLRNRHPGAAEPHRPGAVFSYMQHDSFEPRFIVDVTSAWETKIAALRCYESQLYPAASSASAQEGEPTKTASREFWLTVEGRARHFGQMINAELGEPFWSRVPLAVSDLAAIVPGGLR
jgi:bacillithiol biosynthesis deacetylase BshB1